MTATMMTALKTAPTSKLECLINSSNAEIARFALLVLLDRTERVLASFERAAKTVRFEAKVWS